MCNWGCMLRVSAVTFSNQQRQNNYINFGAKVPSKAFVNPIKTKFPKGDSCLEGLSSSLVDSINKSAYKSGLSNEEWLRKILGIPVLKAVEAAKSRSAKIGNSKVTTLIDGDQYFQKAMEFVNGAQKSIQIEMFEFQNLSVDGKHWAQGGAEKFKGGQQQQQLLWTLVKKKKENPDMKIQVILDAHKWYMDSKNASRKHYANKDMIKFLKESNIDVVPYPRAAQQGSNLQHIKLLVVDGEKAILGGMNWGSHSAVNHDACVALERLPGKTNSEVDNIIAQHFNPDWKFSWERLGATDLVAGPLNEEQQALYNGINKEIKPENVEYYNLLKDVYNTPAMKERYAKGDLELLEAHPIENPTIKILGTKPRELEKVGEKGIETTREFLMQKVKTAKKMRAELFVLTDKEVVQTVIKRHKSGELDAKFIVEADIINKFPYCENAYDALREAGVPVRVYKSNKHLNQRMHAKWAVFDDKEVVIGSTNWSSQGLNQNLKTGMRDDYALSTARIDRSIKDSLKKVNPSEKKLGLSRLKWSGEESSYTKLKERMATLKKSYMKLKKKGEVQFQLDGKEYGYKLDDNFVTVDGKVLPFKNKDEKDSLAELRRVIGYYNIVQRKHLSKQRYMRGNNEIAVAFDSESLARNVFLKQFEQDWKYSESTYDQLKDKVIPINRKKLDVKG